MKKTVPPPLVKISLCIILLYYVVSVITAVTPLIPVRYQSPWALFLKGEDVLYSLNFFDAHKRRVADTWVRVTLVFHRENPVVLFALSQRALQQNNEAHGEELLERANSLDPYNAEYRNEWIQYLLVNKKYERLKQDIHERGFEGIDGKWASWLYVAGLTFFEQNDMLGTSPFWRTAAEITPSWSYLWIEYASLLYALDKREDSLTVLRVCSKDVFAGEHCREVLRRFEQHDPAPPGYYRESIQNEVR